jgi:hypothetical protein
LVSATCFMQTTMFTASPQTLLTITQADTKAASGVAPVDSALSANNTAGATFHAAMPGKSELTIFDHVILDRANIQTWFFCAILADLQIDCDMRGCIHIESCLS